MGEQSFQNQAVVCGCTGMGNAVGSVLWVDVGVRQNMIFLLDTGSGLCLGKQSHIREGTVYNSTTSVYSSSI
jgi:hypothetical protein